MSELKREIITTIIVMANIVVLIVAAAGVRVALDAWASGVTSPMLAMPGLIFAAYGIIFITMDPRNWTRK